MFGLDVPSVLLSIFFYRVLVASITIHLLYQVESLIACGDIHFKGKKINVGPAVKKNAKNGGNEENEEVAKVCILWIVCKFSTHNSILL